VLQQHLNGPAANTLQPSHLAQQSPSFACQAPFRIGKSAGTAAFLGFCTPS
jgi:hypothetical protein